MKALSTVALAVQIASTPAAFAIAVSDTSKPRFKITIFTTDEKKINGLFLYTSSENVSSYPGSFADWKRKKNFATVSTPVESIERIHLKKKNGLLKGSLIGVGIGILPVLISAAFGEGEGGFYISVVAIPLGLLIGSIIGITSKKKYFISSNPDELARFLNR